MLRYSFISQGFRQWILEMMGQLRATRRASVNAPKSGASSTSSKTDEIAFENFFDIFAFALCLFAGIDTLTFPRERLTSDRDLVRSKMTLAINLTLTSTSEHLRSLGPQISAWLVYLLGLGRASVELETQIKSAFPAFKGCESYHEASVWSRLVPIS